MRTRKPAAPPSAQAIAAKLTKLIAQFPKESRARILAAVQANLALDEIYPAEAQQQLGLATEGATPERSEK